MSEALEFDDFDGDNPFALIPTSKSSVFYDFRQGKCPETVKLIGAGPNDKPTFHREQDKSQSLATTHRLEIPRLTTSANYSPFTVIVDLLLPELPQAGKPLSLVQVSCSSYPLISVDNAGAVYCGHNKTPFRSPNPLFKLKTNKWYRVAAAVIDADNSTKGTATIFLDGKVVMSQSIPYYEDAFSSKSTIHFFGATEKKDSAGFPCRVRLIETGLEALTPIHAKQQAACNKMSTAVYSKAAEAKRLSKTLFLGGCRIRRPVPLWRHPTVAGLMHLSENATGHPVDQLAAFAALIKKTVENVEAKSNNFLGATILNKIPSTDLAKLKQVGNALTDCANLARSYPISHHRDNVYMYLKKLYPLLAGLQVGGLLAIPLFVAQQKAGGESPFGLVILHRKTTDQVDMSFCLLYVSTANYLPHAVGGSPPRHLIKPYLNVRNVPYTAINDEMWWFLLYSNLSLPENEKDHAVDKALIERLLPVLTSLPSSVHLAQTAADATIPYIDKPLAIACPPFTVNLESALIASLKALGCTFQTEVILLAIKATIFDCSRSDLMQMKEIEDADVQSLRVYYKLLNYELSLIMDPTAVGAPIIPRTAIDGHLIKPAEIKAKQAELEAIAKAVSPDTTTVMNVVNDSIEAEMKTKLSESAKAIWLPPPLQLRETNGKIVSRDNVLFPHFNRFLRLDSVEGYAGQHAPRYPYRPIDFSTIARMPVTRVDMVDVLRELELLVTLIANQRMHVKNGPSLIISAFEFAMFQVLTMPKPALSQAEKTCPWRESISYGDQLDILMLLQRLSTHFIAAVASVGKSVAVEASSVIIMSCIACIADVTMRTKANNHTSMILKGIQEGAVGFYTVDLKPRMENLVITQPEAFVARGNVLDYFESNGVGTYLMSLAEPTSPGEAYSDLFKPVLEQLALPPGNPEPYLCADGDPCLLVNFPELECIRDINLLYRFALGSSREAWPAVKPASPYSQSSATPAFSYDNNQFSIKLFGQDVPEGLFEEFQPGRSINPMLTDPSHLTKPNEVKTEDDVLHLPTLPTFNDNLSQSESEALLSYLTVPYLRLPLVLGFFANEERIHTLRDASIRSLLRQCVFEAGPYIPYFKVDTPSLVPTPDREQLSTCYGYLFNELVNSPQFVIDAAIKITKLALATDTGTVHSSSRDIIFFAIELLGGIESYTAMLVSIMEGTHPYLTTSVFRVKPTKANLKILKDGLSKMEKLLRGPTLKILDVYQVEIFRDTKRLMLQLEEEHNNRMRGVESVQPEAKTQAVVAAQGKKKKVQDPRDVKPTTVDGLTKIACTLHMYSIIIFRNCFDQTLLDRFGDKRLRAPNRGVDVLPSSFLFLTTSHTFGTNVDSPVESIVMDALRTTRNALILYIRQMYQASLNNLMELIMAVSTGRNVRNCRGLALYAGIEAANRSNDDDDDSKVRRWCFVEGDRNVGRFVINSQADTVSRGNKAAREAQAQSAVALQRPEAIKDDYVAIDVDLQIAQMTLRSSHISALPTAVAADHDVIDLLGSNVMQASTLVDAEFLKRFRLVDRDYVLDYWSSNPKVPFQFVKYSSEDIYSPGTLSENFGWVELHMAHLQQVLPDCPQAWCFGDGFQDEETDKVVLFAPDQGIVHEAHLYKSSNYFEVYYIYNHGYHHYRTLYFTSDALRCYGSIQVSTGDRLTQADSHLVRCASMNKRINATTVVISRGPSVGGNLSGSRETYVPSRLLRGLIPNVLTDNYTFWLDESDNLRGYSRDPANNMFVIYIRLVAAHPSPELVARRPKQFKKREIDPVYAAKKKQEKEEEEKARQAAKLAAGDSNDDDLVPVGSPTPSDEPEQDATFEEVVNAQIYRIPTLMMESMLETAGQFADALLKQEFAWIDQQDLPEFPVGDDEEEGNTKKDEHKEVEEKKAEAPVVTNSPLISAKLVADNSERFTELAKRMRNATRYLSSKSEMRSRAAQVAQVAMNEYYTEQMSTYIPTYTPSLKGYIDVPNKTAPAFDYGNGIMSGKGNLDYDVLELVNVRDAPVNSALTCLVSNLTRIETLAFILCWRRLDASETDEVNLALVDLPRLKLSFASKRDNKGIMRMFSLDHSNLYISDFRSDAINHLVRGLPLALLLSSENHELHVLVPSVEPIRVLYQDNPLSTHIVPNFRNKGWYDACDPKYYIYPIHISHAFMSTPTLASALYLLLLRFLYRSYDDVFRLGETIATDMAFSKEETYIFNSLAQCAGDLNPDAIACLLKICIATQDSSVKAPFEVTDALINYSRLQHRISAWCRLPYHELYSLHQKEYEKFGSDAHKKYPANFERHYLRSLIFGLPVAPFEPPSLFRDRNYNFSHGILNPKAPNIFPIVKAFYPKQVDLSKNPSLSAAEKQALTDPAPENITKFASKQSRYAQIKSFSGPSAFQIIDNAFHKGLAQEDDHLRADKSNYGFLFYYSLLGTGSTTECSVGTQDGSITLAKYAHICLRKSPGEGDMMDNIIRFLIFNQHFRPHFAKDQKVTSGTSIYDVEVMTALKHFAAGVAKAIESGVKPTHPDFRVPSNLSLSVESMTAANSVPIWDDGPRIGIIPRVTDYACRMRVAGGVPSALMTKYTAAMKAVVAASVGADKESNYTIDSSLLKSLFSKPLESLKLDQFFDKATRKERGLTPVSEKVPFDLRGHPESGSSNSTKMLDRIVNDVSVYAEGENKATGVFIKGLEEGKLKAVVASGTAEIKKMITATRPILTKLESDLVNMRDGDAKFVESSIAYVKQVANHVTVDKAKQSAEDYLLRTSYILRRKAGLEPEISTEYVMACMLSSSAVFDLQKVNPFLNTGDIALLFSVLEVVLLRGNRMGQINRALQDTRGLLSLLNKLENAANQSKDGKVNNQGLIAELVQVSESLGRGLIAERYIGKPFSGNAKGPSGKALEVDGRTLMVGASSVRPFTTDFTQPAPEDEAMPPLYVNGIESKYIKDIEDKKLDDLQTAMVTTGEGGAKDLIEYDPRYLLFEFIFNFPMRKSQKSMVDDFVVKAHKEESIVRQMIMGAGKTTVIAPLLALFLGDGKKLIVQVVPPALLELSRSVMRACFSSILFKRVYTLHFERNTVADKTLYNKLRLAARNRGVVITTPTSVKSAMLHHVEITQQITNLKAPRPPALFNETMYLSKILDLFKNGILLMDEVDMILHPLKSELNFPIGEKEDLDFNPLRWRLAIHIIDAIFYAVKPRDNMPLKESPAAMEVLDRLAKAIKDGYNSRSLQSSPHLVLLDSDFYDQKLKSVMCDWIIIWLQNQHITMDPAKLRQYLLEGSHNNQELVDTMNKAFKSKKMKMLNLAHDWLASFLPHVLQKIDRVSFGLLSESDIANALAEDPNLPTARRKMVVPFVGKDVPSKSSEFAHPDIIIGLNILAYRYEGLRRADFDEIVTQQLATMAKELGRYDTRQSSIRYAKWIRDAGGRIKSKNTLEESKNAEGEEGESALDFVPLYLLSPSNVDQMSRLFKLLRQELEVLHWYLEEMLFPTFMRSQCVKLSASGVDLGGEMLFKTRIGFSGTPSNLVPLELGGCVYEHGSDGQMISVLTSPEVMSFDVLKEGWNVHTLLDYVAKATTPHGAAPYHALIDTGALITGMSNYQVARYLLDNGLKWAEGIVFLDEFDRKMILVRSTGRVLKLEQCGIPTDKRFAFYDQVHTVGMDIKHRLDACAVLTLGKDMIFRDLCQGAYRMRGIAKGQTVRILSIPEIERLASIQLALCYNASLPVSKADSTASPNPKQQLTPNDIITKIPPLARVTAWLILNSMRSERVQYNQLALQNLSNVWRKAAFNMVVSNQSYFSITQFPVDPKKLPEAAATKNPKLERALEIFKEDIDFTIPEQVPQSKPFGTILREMYEKHADLVTEEKEKKVCEAIIAEVEANSEKATPTEDNALVAEMVQQVEQEQEREQEQEQEQEVEIEKCVDLAYKRDREEQTPWNFFTTLSKDLREEYDQYEKNESGQRLTSAERKKKRGQLLEDTKDAEFKLPPRSQFYPANTFSAQGRSELAMPDTMYISNNYYDNLWEGDRRIKNVTMVMEVVPRPANLKRAKKRIIGPSTQAIVDNSKNRGYLEAISKAYNLFDANDSGDLSVDEVRPLLRAIMATQPTAEELKVLFKGDLTRSIRVADMTECVDKGMLHPTDEGRYFVVVSLKEAETLRRILHSYQNDGEGGSDDLPIHLALRIVPLDNAVLDKSKSYDDAVAPHHQVEEVYQVARYFNNESHFTHDQLLTLIQALDAHTPFERKVFFDSVMACRRRSRKQFSDQPITKVFRAMTSAHLLKLRAIGWRIREGIKAKELLPYDAFKAFDHSHNGDLSADELYGALTWLGVKLEPIDVVDFISWVEQPNVQQAASQEEGKGDQIGAIDYKGFTELIRDPDQNKLSGEDDTAVSNEERGKTNSEVPIIPPRDTEVFKTLYAELRKKAAEEEEKQALEMASIHLSWQKKMDLDTEYIPFPTGTNSIYASKSSTSIYVIQPSPKVDPNDKDKFAKYTTHGVRYDFSRATLVDPAGIKNVPANTLIRVLSGTPYFIQSLVPPADVLKNSFVAFTQEKYLEREKTYLEAEANAKGSGNTKGHSATSLLVTPGHSIRLKLPVPPIPASNAKALESAAQGPKIPTLESVKAYPNAGWRLRLLARFIKCTDKYDSDTTGEHDIILISRVKGGGLPHTVNVPNPKGSKAPPTVVVKPYDPTCFIGLTPKGQVYTSVSSRSTYATPVIDKVNNSVYQEYTFIYDRSTSAKGVLHVTRSGKLIVTVPQHTLPECFHEPNFGNLIDLFPQNTGSAWAIQVQAVAFEYLTNENSPKNVNINPYRCQLGVPGYLDTYYTCKRCGRFFLDPTVTKCGETNCQGAFYIPPTLTCKGCNVTLPNKRDNPDDPAVKCKTCNTSNQTIGTIRPHWVTNSMILKN